MVFMELWNLFGDSYISALIISKFGIRLWLWNLENNFTHFWSVIISSQVASINYTIDWQQRHARKIEKFDFTINNLIKCTDIIITHFKTNGEIYSIYPLYPLGITQLWQSLMEGSIRFPRTFQWVCKGS